MNGSAVMSNQKVKYYFSINTPVLFFVTDTQKCLIPIEKYETCGQKLDYYQGRI